MPVTAPSAGRLIAAAGLIGGVPVAAQLLLLLGGWTSVLPGLIALLTTILGAFVLARLWLGNLQRLGEAMRRAELGETEPRDEPNGRLLPSVAEIAEGVRRIARGVNERAELVMRLRRADQAILERLPDPLVVLDGNGAALRANAAARALFASAQGQVGNLAALLRHPALAEAMDAVRGGAGAREVDVALPVPVMRELKVHLIPMEPPLADGGQLLLVLSDRTRERAVERMRADFVANASHELRTPLASMIGFIETLLGPAQDDAEARTRFLGIMAEQSERMRRLIDDLLGLSRIEVTEHQPPAGQVDLAALAAMEADALAPLLATRRVTLETKLEEGAIAAPADAGQLGQVVRNLLENAVRYGLDGGHVTLTVARAATDPRLPARPGVVLSVSDDGPGIARHHLPRLTERFYRVDRGRARSAGGTGLGLAIVKHIVNRHRGQLLIDSEEGVGSTFRVWLPAEG